MARFSSGVLALPAVAGTGLVLWVARSDMYVSHDGLAYVGAARRLVAGSGFETPAGSPPIENFAPLYPLLLGGIGELGPDPLTVARVLNPLLLGLTALVISIAVSRITASLLLGVTAGVLVAAGTDALTYYSSALSEPLFVFLSTCSVISVIAAIRRGGWWLGAAIVFTAAAVLTRYAGAALVAGGAVGLVLVPRPRRLVEAALFAVGSMGPVTLWLVSSDGVGHREAVWHGIDRDYFAHLRPVTVALVAAAVAVVLASRRRRVDAASALGLTAAAYLAVLVGDRLLFDFTGRLDARFLLPLHILAVAALAAYLPRSRAAVAVLGAVALVQAGSGALWIRDTIERNDRGFVSESWSGAPIFAEVRRAPPDAAIYSNGVDVIAFHTGRITRAVPEKRVLLTGEPNPHYDEEAAAMTRAAGLLIWFDPPARRVFLPTPAELGLTVVRRDDVSTTYRLSGR